jgi:hypothetical protein
LCSAIPLEDIEAIMGRKLANSPAPFRITIHLVRAAALMMGAKIPTATQPSVIWLSHPARFMMSSHYRKIRRSADSAHQPFSTTVQMPASYE